MEMNSERTKWIESAYSALRTELMPECPERVTITFGFPSKGARKGKYQRLGECAHGFIQGLDLADNKSFITLNPCIFDNPSRVLDVLLHEMIHVAYPTSGHKGDFRKTALRVGLIGAMTATQAGPVLQITLDKILSLLPEMPKGHGELTAKTKVQSTRLHKYVCPDCGQVIRAATTSLNAVCANCDVNFILK